MASKLKKTRTITDKVSVKGHLTEDGTSIVYSDENDVERIVTVESLISVFKDKDIDLSISLKTEDELPEDEDAETEE